MEPKALSSNCSPSGNNSNASNHCESFDFKLKVTPEKNDYQLPVMRCHRTPLRSPSRSYTNLPFTSIKEEKFPVKRCFSKEVFELSQRHLIVTKKSKVDFGPVPPKRIRLHDFNYTSSRSHQACSGKSSSTRDCSSKKEDCKTLVPRHPGQLSILHSQDNPRKYRIDRQRKDGTTTISLTHDGNRKVRNVSHFLVSVENFPHGEWKENNYSADMLREIIFLSEAKAIPVILIKKELHELVVKLANAGDASFINGVHPPSTHKGVALYDILKSPFTLTFKAISGVIRWVVGD